MVSVFNRITRLLALWHLLQSSYVIAQTTKAPATASQPYSLPELSNDLSTVGRVVNGMALGMWITNGKADNDSIVSELLNLGPGVTMNSLVDKNVTGLETDLGKITEAVEKACGTAGECVKKTVIDAGTSALSTIDRIAFKDIDTILNDGSMLHKIVELKRVNKKLGGTETYMGDVINQIELVKSTPNTDTQTVKQILSDLDSFIRRFVKSEAHFKDVFASAKQVDQGKVLAEIAKLLVLQPYSKVSSDFNLKLKAMKDELSDAEQKSASLLNLFSKDSIDEMNGRLEILKGVVAPKGSDEKVITGGFFNGFSDLDSLLKDAESPIVKKMFPGEQTVQQIKNLLDPVIKFKKSSQSVWTNWESMKFSDGVAKHIDSIRSVLKTAQEEVPNGLSAYNPLYKCTKDMETSNTYDLTELNTMKNELAKLSDAITALSTIFTAHKHVYPLLGNLTSLVNITETGNITEIFDKVKSWGMLNDLESKLKAFQQDIGKQNGKKLTKVLDNVDENLFDGKLKSWVSGLGISKSLDCLDQNQGLTEATAAAPIQSLTSLTSKNTDIVSVQSAATALKAPLVDWTPAKSTRSKKDVTNGSDYNQLIQETKKFTDGIAVIRASAAAFSASDNIVRLLGADAAIAIEVGKVTDKNLRAEIARVWKDSKDVLTMLPNAVKEMSKLVKQRPNNLTDFGTFFKDAQTVTIGNIDCDALSRVFGSFKTPADLSGTLKSLEHVRFSNATDKLKFASGSTSTITHLLNSYWTTVPKQKQGATASPLVSNATDKVEETSIWMYIVYSLVVILVVGIIGTVGWLVVRCTKKKPEKALPDNESGRIEHQRTTPNASVTVVDETKDEKPKVGAGVAEGKTNAQPKDDQAHSIEDKLKSVENCNKSVDNAAYECRRDNQGGATVVKVAEQPGKNEEVKKDPALEALAEEARKDDKYTEEFVKKVKPKKFVCPANPENIGKPVETLSGPTDKDKQNEPKFIHADRLLFANAYDQAAAPIPGAEAAAETALMVSEASTKGGNTISTANLISCDENEKTGKALKPNASMANTQDQTRSQGAGESSFELDEEFISKLLEESIANHRMKAEQEKDDIAELNTPENEALMEEVVKCVDENLGNDFFGDEYQNAQEEEEIEEERESEDERVEAAGDPKKKIVGAAKGNVKKDGAGGKPKKGKKIDLRSKLPSVSKCLERIRSKDKTAEFPDLAPLDKCTGLFERFDNLSLSDILNPVVATEILQVLFSKLFQDHLGVRQKGVRRTRIGITPKFACMVVQAFSEVVKKDAALILVDGLVRVIGDLHGQMDTFRRIMCYDGFMDGYRVVCLGDYVDRGPNSVALGIAMMLMKIVYPNDFFMLRGNHENMHINAVYGFLRENREEFGWICGVKTWVEFNKGFKFLPRACIINRFALAVHGGISPSLFGSNITYENFKNLFNKEPTTETEIQFNYDLQWTEFVNILLDFQKSPRNADSFVFGKNAVIKALKLMKIDVIFAGHEKVRYGVQFHAGVLFVVIFSAPNSRDVWNIVTTINDGSIAICYPNKEVHVITFVCLDTHHIGGKEIMDDHSEEENYN